MKNTTRFTSVIAAGLLASAPAFAGDFLWDVSNPVGSRDTYGHVLYDLNKPAFVGTGMAMAKTRIDPYSGLVAGNTEINRTGSAGPEGDFFGWVVLDIGAWGSRK